MLFTLVVYLLWQRESRFKPVDKKMNPIERSDLKSLKLDAMTVHMMRGSYYVMPGRSIRQSLVRHFVNLANGLRHHLLMAYHNTCICNARVHRTHS